MSLIVRLQPHPDESLHGFLRRVSAGNLAPSVKTFLASFGVKSRLVYSDAEFAQLAEVLHLDAAQLAVRQPVPDSGDVLLRPKYQTREGHKVCPLCIAQHPYQRIGWGHVLMTACPHHDIQLVSSCVACGQGFNALGQLDRCIDHFFICRRRIQTFFFKPVGAVEHLTLVHAVRNEVQVVFQRTDRFGHFGDRGVIAPIGDVIVQRLDIAVVDEFGDGQIPHFQHVEILLGAKHRFDFVVGLVERRRNQIDFDIRIGRFELGDHFF